MESNPECTRQQRPPQAPRSAARPAPPTADRARLRAAARLLGEDSPTVRKALRAEFAAGGRLARRVLRKALSAEGAKARTHARALLGELERRDALRRLIAYARRDTLDLEQGLFLLARLDRPDFDARPYRRALDAMAERVRERGAEAADELARGRALSEYLGGELGYRGDPSAGFGPDDAWLHRAIERKAGLPLTLVALYVLVARRAGLRVGAVPLPGHVMLRIHGRGQNAIVDPFHGGETRSQLSLMSYLAQNGLAFQAVWFRDADARSLLLRQARNLANAYVAIGRRAQARELAPLIDALMRG